MTHGDSTSIKCPACRAAISNPLGGELPEKHGIVEKVTTCPRCGVSLRLWARWSITVEAERESRVR